MNSTIKRFLHVPWLLLYVPWVLFLFAIATILTLLELVLGKGRSILAFNSDGA